MRNREAPTRRQVFVAVAFTATLLLGVILIKARSSESVGYDFISIYTPALLMREGCGGGIYDPQVQARVQKSLFNRPNVLMGIHPPFELALVAPITKLAYAKAYAVWGAFDVALWMLFAYLIRPYAPAPKNTLRYLLLCFTFFPAWVALLQGQTSLLLLVSWAFAFVFIKRRQDFWAGVFLGLGLFKFPVVLPFALICLLRGRWKLLGGFVSAASLVGALSITVVGVAGVHAYVDLLLDIMQKPINPPYWSISLSNMPTLRGFLGALLAGKVAARSIQAAAALVSILLIALTAWRWRHEDRAGGGSSDLMFAASLVVSEVAAPYLYTHDLTPTLLAVLLVIGSPEWSRNPACRLIVTVSVVILYIPLYPFLVPLGALFLLAPVLVAFALATSLFPSAEGQEV
jgi:hypothetical protein